MLIDTDEKREKRQAKFDEEKRNYYQKKYKETGSKVYLMLANKEGIDTDWTRDDDQVN